MCDFMSGRSFPQGAKDTLRPPAPKAGAGAAVG